MHQGARTALLGLLAGLCGLGWGQAGPAALAASAALLPLLWGLAPHRGAKTRARAATQTVGAPVPEPEADADTPAAE